MSFWDSIFGQLSSPQQAQQANDDLRNSIFGMGTATMPMPGYDDNLPRLQRRMYDMPQMVEPPQPYAPVTSSDDPFALFEGGQKPTENEHTPAIVNGPDTGHSPAPGEFYFGGATSAVNPPPLPPVGWQPPQNSLVPWPSNADRADAADIARNLGGTMFAQPGAALDPNGRPILVNPDGGMSTERNIGVSDPRLNNGRYTNIPSIQEGRQLSVNQAIEWALKSGISYPSFDTPEEADAAAIARHRKLEPAGQPGQPITLPPVQNTPDYMSDALTTRLMQALLGRRGP